MPVRPRKGIAKRTDGGGLTEPELEDLIVGFTFFEEPFRNEEERRKCWKKNRDFIMRQQGPPGKEATGFNRDTYDFLTRPSAWWVYDAPGPRRFTSCRNGFCPKFSVCPVAKNSPTEAPDCLFREGEPRTGGSFDGLYRLDCVSHKFKIFLPEQESEGAFLWRNGLLNDAERLHIEKHPELSGPEKIKN